LDCPVFNFGPSATTIRIFSKEPEMLNEGLISNDSVALMKSEIVNQIRRLGITTPHDLERTVFKALVGRDREEVDWEIEGNQAGYFTWVKSFDRLIGELIDDGYIRDDEHGNLAPTEAEPRSDYSHIVYPPPSSC
jgi:hypothetical protein